MPRAVRDGVRERLVWHRRPRTVPIASLLLGGQNRVSAIDFAAASGDLLWGSTRVAQGPHAQLLARAAAGPISDEELLASPYATMARTCIALSGQYFDATDDDGVVRVARTYLRRCLSGEGDDEAARPPHASEPGVPVRVAPIRGSGCYQVLDGHHRVAAAAQAGETTIEVQVNRMSTVTPLMDLLNRMTWIGGASERYQPLDAPELAGWPTVRACTDRLTKMQVQAAELGLGPGADYLDVASCYGWFVSRMQQAGFTAQGLERDPLAPALGAAVYGLEPAAIITGDAVDELRSTDRTWEVVSCFSLLHHFILGRASVDGEALIRLLDKVTGRLLIIDTGQAHEHWFAESLAEWDTARVAAFLAEHTSFDRIVDLGPDDDDRAPYAGNYGRHLFACIRDVR